MNTRSFHDEIRRNKRTSVLFVALVAVVLAGLGWSIGLYFGDPRVGVGIALLFAAIQVLVLLTMGDSIALLAAGAKEVSHAEEPVLYNVVEEMSIAAGIPMPRVFVIETDSMNAFATGMSPQRAAVAVTRGLMRRLNRDELQGVIAHEMSHIRFYDIRLSIVVAVMVGAIVMLSDMFLRWAFWFGGRGSSRDRGQGQAVIMLIAIVFAILAPIFAMLLQFAVSRRREYLADAGAAELTRYPAGLASALRKLAYSNKPFKEAGKAFSHLYIVNPLKPATKLSSAFATHPPIEERIKRLEQMALIYSAPGEEGNGSGPAASQGRRKG